ncbi:MAG: hypothetical protein WCG12_20655 [Alcaligenaceae bacterium]
MGQLSRAVLSKSFWRSMAGSMNLFSTHPAPAPVRVEVKPLRAPIASLADAIHADWVQTGMDIDSAITRYVHRISSPR